MPTQISLNKYDFSKRESSKVFPSSDYSILFPYI